jgi:hypothetical protein
MSRCSPTYRTSPWTSKLTSFLYTSPLYYVSYKKHLTVYTLLLGTEHGAAGYKHVKLQAARTWVVRLPSFFARWDKRDKRDFGELRMGPTGSRRTRQVPLLINLCTFLRLDRQVVTVLRFYFFTIGFSRFVLFSAGFARLQSPSGTLQLPARTLHVHGVLCTSCSASTYQSGLRTGLVGRNR